MLHTILPEDMKRVENRAMEAQGVSALTLMERAARYVADAALPYLKGDGELLVVCGPGNNGGDGLAAARMLLADRPKLKVTVWKLAGEPTAETAAQWRRLEAFLQRVTILPLTDQPLTVNDRVVCGIDALFGTGLNRPLEGAALLAVRALNASGVPVIAVDIPSGLNGVTGTLPEGAQPDAAVCAALTVTFHRPKPGLFLGDGPDCCGRVLVADIGILPEWDDAPGQAVLCSGDRLLPPRKRNTHKGDYGRVLVLAGSRGMAGAAGLCATAALRAGAGLVTVACPEGIVPVVQTLCPCATCLPLPETDADEAWKLLEGALEKADALAAGCGLGRETFVSELMKRLIPWLCRRGLPTVLDADALNWLAANGGVARFSPWVVLTPHPGEAARLLKRTAAEIDRNQVENARDIYVKYGASVVLKGNSNAIIGDDGEAISVFGTPAMAKGGSGDTLTGVLAAMLAGQDSYGLHGIRLLQTACALHGLAGELAAQRYGERGMLATDLCKVLGRVPNTVETAGRIGVVSTAVPTESAEKPAPTAPRIFTPKIPQATGGLETRVHPCVSAMNDALRAVLGRRVRVTVDRPLGSRHPEHRELTYRLNYGYVADVLAADNEWQDAYIFGVSEPLVFFEGEVVAVIHRSNDVEDKWVVAAPGARPTEQEIREQTAFAEGFFQTVIFVK